MELNFNT